MCFIPILETTIYVVSIRIGIIVLSQGNGFLRTNLLAAETGDAFVGIYLWEMVAH